ncbi:tyrosine-type recombinase/integrase [Bacillus velezensis]|uniref:tyrosine-type recombinase/integrase n=1 Tax=Bacillus velezensis TaxID=492670 RepID=UPI00112CEEE7|nr:tyrosine-type recombinase/integrase [Bacillus velezensis]QDF49595.1 phage integrase [Bacillus velezensis]QDF53241.1 phage integrase [Bacillus velezensis]
MVRKFIAQRRPTAGLEIRRPRKNQRQEVDVTYTIEEALRIFIQAKEAEGLRSRTIKDYRQHISYLSEFLLENHPDVIDDVNSLTTNHVREYINYLRNDRRPYKGAEHRKEIDRSGLAVNTINIRLRTLKTMCRFWYDEVMIETNPMIGVKPVKDDERKEVEGLADENIGKVFNALDDRQFAEWRDKVLMYLMLDTGLRPEEALTVRIEQFDFRSMFVLVPSMIAKNRKGREIPITREVGRMVRDLYEETKQYFGDPEQVFMNAYGEPFTAGAFRKRLNRMKKRLNLEKLHPNMFRHTFARKYLLNGGDIFTLQKILDHADIATTRKYVQMTNEDVKAQHNKYSPARRFLRR